MATEKECGHCGKRFNAEIGERGFVLPPKAVVKRAYCTRKCKRLAALIRAAERAAERTL
jgi:hypothetical protein